MFYNLLACQYNLVSIMQLIQILKRRFTAKTSKTLDIRIFGPQPSLIISFDILSKRTMTIWYLIKQNWNYSHITGETKS